MLRELKLQKYPNKTSSFRSQVLNSLTLLEKLPYSNDTKTHLFKGFESQYERNYQVYITSKHNPLNSQVLENIEFIEKSPNILVLECHPSQQYLIVEEQTLESLTAYQIYRESKIGLPFINELEAKDIILDLGQSLNCYTSNSLFYDCLHSDNIVRVRGRWELSLVGVLVQHEKLSADYFPQSTVLSKKRLSREEEEQSIIYALGSLMFKMLFGFVPFEGGNRLQKSQQSSFFSRKEESPNSDKFEFSKYIDYLEGEHNKKMLKVYYFSDRIQLISQPCLQLIERALSGRIRSIQEFFKEEFFTLPPQPIKPLLEENREVKMISFFSKKYHSLIMASIDRKNKHPYEKLNHKLEQEVASFIQWSEECKKDPNFKHINFSKPQSLDSKLKQNEGQDYRAFQLQCQYFDKQFDTEYVSEQFPCRELIKFIEGDRKKYPDLHEKDESRESRIKMYAYPYTMVYELLKVYHEQSLEHKKRIDQLIPLLLELSASNWPVDRLERLHSTQQQKTCFEDYKIKFRELINALYKQFLLEAMKRYNSKEDHLTFSERIRLKNEGLEYYKLCLKLMEVSLLMRKKGQNLDLQRIETSERKEIEYDLEVLLKRYFPNRVEIR